LQRSHARSSPRHPPQLLVSLRHDNNGRRRPASAPHRLSGQHEPPARECLPRHPRCAPRLPPRRGGRVLRVRQTAVVIRDSCLLRYSNASFFGVADRSYEVKTCSVGASQPNGFGPRLTGLMSSLAFTAAYGSPRLFAAGEVRVAPEVTLYGMVQCTRDLAADDCSLCLSSVLLNIPYYCDQMLLFCCSIRHEVYPFFDNQAVEAAMS
jgi:hypothetical protein